MSKFEKRAKFHETMALAYRGMDRAETVLKVEAVRIQELLAEITTNLKLEAKS